MANFEFEFNEQDRELIVSQDTQLFDGTLFDYARLTIYPTEAINNIVTLQDDSQAIFYSSISETEFDINISPFGAGLDELRLKTIGGGENDFIIYKNPDGNIYIKPNEIFNEFELPQGDYKIQIDFLNQLNPSTTTPSTEDDNDLEDGEMSEDSDNDASVQQQFYQFIIKQISTSRKEVRLKLLDKDIVNNSIEIDRITNQLNNNEPEFLDDGEPNSNYKYQFKHILNIGTGDHIPIMNYQFDKITDGRDNQSIILKLYDALPTNVGNLSMVTIEREVLTTQTLDTFYFSDVPDVYFGDGLLTDTSINWENQNNQDFGFENYDELSGSLDNISFDSLISQSKYNYPNINTDFNEFENHTFFGSVKRKLEIFETKIKTIQSYYSEISSSLVVSSSIVGDESTVIQRREDLFNLINEEIKTFSPYERFLYYDGQSESTASAPGLINYADTIPVTLSGEGVSLDSINGFNNVYKHSSEKISGIHNQFIDLFTDKYHVHKKPFFNYSSSIYLSFLLQGDSGSALTWENSNPRADLNKIGGPLPSDIFYQNKILEPQITGSEHQRYIFEASMSYFIPNTDNNDMMDLEFDDGDFDAGSTKITILSGSMKTGSVKMKDTTGVYPTTVITQSGVSFLGSVMPSGELFRIYNQNTLSSSLQGYYDYVDADIVTGGNNFEILDKSGNNNTLEFGGSGTSAFTSASITTGVQGGDAFAFTTTGSNAEAQSGSMFLSTKDSTAPIESAPISMSAVAGDAVTGFTMATFYKSTSTKTNTTIMAMDISTGSAPFSQADAHGWNIQRLGNTIAGEVTREGVNIIDADISADGLKTGTLTPKDGNFHHIAMTYDNITGTGSMFFDGVLQKQGNARGFITGSNQIYRLIVGSGPGSAQGYDDDTFDETRFYTRALTPSEINQLYLHPDGKTETKITDVKVTLKNPSDVLPFDNLFHTSSTEWTNWYNNALTQAETFDTNNIHSFENNLPLYIKESSEYNEMKDFLNLQGEQYDIIRNHIDSLGTIHKRGYKKTNSPPDNTLPMLLSNMGWEAINPFGGNLEETLGTNYLTGITSVEDVKNATWRKTLNNLLYIYKSKGTKNSVRGLLNTYGYPADLISFQEFTDISNNGNNNITPPEFDNVPTSGTGTPEDGIAEDLSFQTGSFTGYSIRKEKFVSYKVSAKEDRILNLDWWMDKANVNNLEFVYKHVNSNREQTILKNSGSGVENLWDLRLLPSSDGLSSSIEFRLNNSQQADTAIGSRNYNITTDYLTFSDGQLWNVMLQRMTGSTSGPGTIEYRLHVAFQEEEKITTYNYATMSISGGLVGNSTDGGKGFFANQNFQSSGSRHADSSSNLFVGGNSPGGLSGSLAEIKAYSTAISTSKFKQHVLDKFSVVGNTSDSHQNELIYHFKLNENYTTASISSSNQSANIIDSSPTCNFNDYSLIKSGEFFTSSMVYGNEIINVVRRTTEPTTQDSIFINPNSSIIGNLSSDISAVDKSKKFIKPSNKLEIFKSPQTFVNNFITQKIGGFDIEKLYLNPKSFYSQSYDELDKYKDEFFRCNPISVDTNKFIRAHENMFNTSIGSALKQIVPASSTFNSDNGEIGVEIKPTILERQKYENKKPTLETNPNTFISSININPSTDNTEILFTKSGSIGVNITNVSTYEQPKSASISVSVTNTSTYEQPKSASINIVSSFSGTKLEMAKSASINYSADTYKSFINLQNLWGRDDNKVYFVNFNSDSGSTNTYNTRHIESRYHFYAIGDNEYYLAKSGSDYLDHKGDNFDNSGRFHNRLFIKDGVHSNITYESLINGSPGNRTGRMIGKTRYFTTSSNGEIILPRNHVSNFSHPFKDRMIEGTQNVNPGRLNFRYEDYSTSSFYRVNVTGGENELIVKGGTPSIDNNTDKIIY